MNRRNWYEYASRIFGIVKLPVPKMLREKYQSEIDFCGLETTPEAVFSTAVFLPITFLFVMLSIFYASGFMNVSMIIITVTFSIVLFYYLVNYTHFLTIHYRNKASAEMALAIIYMSISMKLNKNLENAIAFAATNLKGPLGDDFKKILWKLQTRKIVSSQDALDDLIRKWRAESEEFVDALELIKSSVDEPVEKMERNLKEAVDIVLSGTKSRMKDYAIRMKTPLKIISTFGILLPLLFLIFIPVLVIFKPEFANPALIIFGYDVFLPFAVYLLLKQNYYTRPYSYHQIELANEKKFLQQKKTLSCLISLVVLIVFSFLAYKIFKNPVTFSNEQFNYSLLAVLSLGIGIAVYNLSFFRFLSKNKEIEQIESELPVALFQLSVISSSGGPIESVINDLLVHIRKMKIRKLFKQIVVKMKSFGVDLNKAIFDEKNGVLKNYPSKILEISMKIIVDISKRGSLYLSNALKSISKFLMDANDVNKETDEILSDVTSEIQIINLIFAPITAGIVVGLMAIVMFLFAAFGQSLQEVESFLAGNAFKGIGASYEFLFNVGKQVPFSYFQISVGIYLIEIVYMLSNFLGEIRYGENEVEKKVNTGKSLLIAMFLYSIISLLLYYGVSSMINPAELGALQ